MAFQELYLSIATDLQLLAKTHFKPNQSRNQLSLHLSSKSLRNKIKSLSSSRSSSSMKSTTNPYSLIKLKSTYNSPSKLFSFSNSIWSLSKLGCFWLRGFSTTRTSFSRKSISKRNSTFWDILAAMKRILKRTSITFPSRTPSCQLNQEKAV